MQEILWNFSRLKDEKKRLRLKQNPHFYQWLPTSPEEYGGDFRIEPIEHFPHRRAHVLTNSPGRIFLETAQHKRAFGNAWVPKNAIIFKGSRLPVIPFSPFLISFRCLWKA
jgi:hypothetical protein